jgi:hypothetical protein
MYWDDLNLKEKGAYGPIRAYIQSKIANILFSAELGMSFTVVQIK